MVISRRIVLAAVLAAGAGMGAAWMLSSRSSAPSAQNDEAAAAGEDIVQQALRAGKPTVVEFGANACAACREMKPVLEALRRAHGERIMVVDIDLIAQRDAGYLQRYRIQLMPTQVFFDSQGREIGRNTGKISAQEILARLGAGGR